MCISNWPWDRDEWPAIKKKRLSNLQDKFLIILQNNICQQRDVLSFDLLKQMFLSDIRRDKNIHLAA
jgi:hypothetical protein